MGLDGATDNQVDAFWTAAHFRKPEAAREFIESKLWRNGPVCPKCGATPERVGRLQGRSTRPGVYKCYACRQPFTVKLGTVFEASHVGLHLWLQAICLLAAPTGSTTIRDLEVILGISRRTAWLLKRRISGLLAQERPVCLGIQDPRAAIPASPQAQNGEARVAPRQTAERLEDPVPEAPELPLGLPAKEHKVGKHRHRNRRPKRKSDPQSKQLELLPE